MSCFSFQYSDADFARIGRHAAEHAEVNHLKVKIYFVNLC